MIAEDTQIKIKLLLKMRLCEVIKLHILQRDEL